MPLYDLKCFRCGEKSSIFRKVDERDLDIPSCSCGAPFQRVISPPMISALSFFEPFQSPASGEWITSRTQHREDLKKTGHILWEPGLSQDIARRREEIKAKDFEKVEKAVDTYVAAAVSAGKLET